MRAISARNDAARWLSGSALAPEPASFTSICPQCRSEQLQRGFTRAELLRLLDGGHVIEAYCVGCFQFWPIDRAARSALAREFEY
ncbi:MAG TPA: hypothetical protein VK695_11585 [Steroidobacteraceae bacterium]|jgi:hypothetical protein|nr:hypothetical protein [Steroidobacteraceae bacterium]